MDMPGITWRGESIEDVEILRELPAELVRLLADTNGFILHEGAVHIRGACLSPDWHSLRTAWRGPEAFHVLYEDVRSSDIPFAQDQVGDQFLIREGIILRLSAETGELGTLVGSLQDFLTGVTSDIEGFLAVGLSHRMQPGQLLHAYPPFCFRESGAGASLRPVPASEVIRFHADLARQLREVPDGGQVEFKLKD
jgi:hypothetical protein